MIKKILFTLLLTQSSYSDIRIYQYLVVNKNNDQKLGKQNIITSSLDPIAYISYHGGKRNIEVDLLRTWMCFGHTAQAKHCPSPYATIPNGVLP